MTEYYNAENLRQFFTSPADMERASEAEQHAASTRLIMAVLRGMRQRYPAAAPLLDACEADEYPMGRLWRDETWGRKAKDLMVEMGLLLPVPEHVRHALYACVACEDGEVASLQDVLCPACQAQQQHATDL